MQIFINILITASIYLILSTAFFLIYNSDKFFNISYAGIIVTSIYLTFLFSKRIGYNFLLSSLLGVVLTILINTFLVFYVYHPMKNKGGNSFNLLISSLGIYIIIIGLIGYFFGYESILLIPEKTDVSFTFLNFNISIVQIILMLLGILFFITISFIYHTTSFGSKIRAISSNLELSSNFGIKTSKISLFVNGIATFLFSIVGIIVGLDTGATPNIGFDLLLYGIIVMIVSGTGNLGYMVLASLLLATVQHLAVFYLDTKWMQSIAYIVLISFLVWKPLGFSGKQLKKVEI